EVDMDSTGARRDDETEQAVNGRTHEAGLAALLDGERADRSDRDTVRTCALDIGPRDFTSPRPHQVRGEGARLRPHARVGSRGTSAGDRDNDGNDEDNRRTPQRGQG